MRAFILVLRYSGVRIGDAVQLTKEKVNGDRIFVRTEKTNVDVWVPVPKDVTASLDALDAKGEYFFWSGGSTLHTAMNKWRARPGKVFKLAGVEGRIHTGTVIRWQRTCCRTESRSRRPPCSWGTRRRSSGVGRLRWRMRCGGFGSNVGTNNEMPALQR